MLLAFRNGGVCGWQNAFIGQPEVYREVHLPHNRRSQRMPLRLCFRVPGPADGDTEHDWQETKSKRANLTHPGKDSLQPRGCPGPGSG
ncbi:Uncharacterised protein [Escherichia coli]|uniref:Uncharacterized protein n=1 Tax=Escherichia coli TaxID=562 RepID=A0A376LNP3_ECOLX|nr:Uncharacterised protein [Escherichia coli]